GHQGEETAQVRATAERLLGAGRYAILTVPHDRIWSYYALVDVFVLASLREGFGLVLLEALACGLPVVAHEYDVTRYVLESHGYLADLTQEGALTAVLARALAAPHTDEMKRARRDYVSKRFDAGALTPAYVDMLRSV